MLGLVGLSLSGRNGQGGGPPPAAPELNPDPNFALGTSGWTNGGGTATVNTGSVDFGGNGAPDLVSPTGANLTAFNASVPSSTALVVRITVTNWVSGSVRCRLKSGAYVDMEITGNGTFTKTVTSGTTTGAGSTQVNGGGGDMIGTVTVFSIKAS